MKGAPDPYTPPAGSEHTIEREPGARSSWPDLLLTLILALSLMPVILMNAVLCYERLAGLGVYDPALGGAPNLQRGPLLVPLLVGLVALIRLGLGRARFVARRYRWALAIIALVAALNVAASRFSEPAFQWGPTGTTLDGQPSRSTIHPC